MIFVTRKSQFTSVALGFSLYLILDCLCLSQYNLIICIAKFTEDFYGTHLKDMFLFK